MKRCTKCILPDTIPYISFDEQGACNYCNEHRTLDQVEYDPIRCDRLLEQATQARIQNGSKYDVLVPVSGGRDSSFIALDLAKTRGLKVLCVNYDNPYSSVQVKQNLRNLVNAIGAELETFTYPYKRHEKSFENNFRAWLKKPDLAAMGLLCLACKPMYLEFFRIARKHKISLIMDGSNPNEVASFKMEAHSGGEGKNIFSLGTIAKMGKKALDNLGYIKPCNVTPLVATMMSLNGNTPYLKYRYRGIEKHGYFYLNPYDEKKIMAALKEVGWEKAKDNNSPWRFDCEIDSLKNVLFKKLIGVTEKDDLFSKNIRTGQMTREEAMARLDEGDVNPEVVERVLRMIGLTPADIDHIGQY